MLFKATQPSLIVLVLSLALVACTGIVELGDPGASDAADVGDASDGGDTSSPPHDTADTTAADADPDCVTQCTGRSCGDDGCGGSCGSCDVGQACDPVAGQCTSTATCGDGMLDPGESCDGDCPQSCPAAEGCTQWSLQGSATQCTAQCVSSTITSCTAGDGCCASGCDANSDSDCAAQCGNGVREGAELCDGDCPQASACVDAVCLERTFVGSESSCDARCEEQPVTSCANGDGCCPQGCDVMTDDDCVLDCRDAAAWPAAWAAAEDAALVEINAQRAAGTDCASGARSPAAAVVMDAALREAARCHSLDMATENFFSHTGSDGSRFWERTAAAGYTGTPRYENIAAGNSQPVAAVGQWMTSTSGHCDAIMDATVTEIGLGYAYGSGTQWGDYWTAVFGQ